jgi:hypothetical protein
MVHQIEYEDEDPAIREEYERDLTKVGLNLQIDEDNYRIADTVAKVRSGELR